MNFENISSVVASVNALIALESSYKFDTELIPVSILATISDW
jgi:hypothetical protein